jgi:hypothetical protein
MAKDYVDVYRGMIQDTKFIADRSNRPLQGNVVALPRKNGIERHAS